MSLLGLLGLALASCQASTFGGSAEEAAKAGTLPAPGAGSVEEVIQRTGAIAVADDLVMIPSGLDDDGCEMFRPYSAVNPVKTAIHYRQAGGGFGIAHDPQVCKVEMTSMGPDQEGCERYRAVPVSADLPPLGDEIVYYQAADGYSARKPEDSCS